MRWHRTKPIRNPRAARTRNDLLAVLLPHAQRAVRCSSREIVVGRQQRQFVTNAELREQRVDGANLHAGAAATIAQFCGIDVILPIRSQKREGREPVDEVFARAWSGEPLQQFLQHQPGGYDGFIAF